MIGLCRRGGNEASEAVCVLFTWTGVVAFSSCELGLGMIDQTRDAVCLPGNGGKDRGEAQVVCSRDGTVVGQGPRTSRGR